jgi:hypothetical protein
MYQFYTEERMSNFIILAKHLSIEDIAFGAVMNIILITSTFPKFFSRKEVKRNIFIIAFK